MALSYWLPGSAQIALGIAMGIISFLVVIYGGFAMNYVNAIPLWNTPLVPVLYVVASFWGGSELALAIFLRAGNAAMAETIESWIRILLLAFIFLVAVYLWSIRYAAPAGNQSVVQIVRGRLSIPFYLGVALFGMAIPLAVSFYSYAMGIGAVGASVFIAAILCQVIGDLSMRYCILKAGVYAPLLPTPAH